LFQMYLRNMLLVLMQIFLQFLEESKSLRHHQKQMQLAGTYASH
ncbi:hypothetical protein T07_11207, partial [Trichinella nelsoni]